MYVCINSNDNSNNDDDTNDHNKGQMGSAPRGIIIIVVFK